jgi:ankyrin repeat protein
VVEFLLTKGVDVNAGTGLHWAAFAAHTDIVRLLLARGAHVATKDDRFAGTPLGWAVYAFRESPRPDLYEVVSLLVRAGADPEEAWYTGSDPRMLAALRGEG